MKSRTTWRSLVSLAFISVAALGQQPVQPPASPPTTIPAVPIKPMANATPAKRVETLKAGVVAPDFTSNDLAGRPVKLSSFSGKVVVLDFWATWCGPCRASLPHTQAVAKQFKDQGVVVLAVCTSDTRAKFDEWVKTNQATYPDVTFACDPNERGSPGFDDRASKKLYGVTGIPTQFIVARDGKIAAVLVGYEAGDVRLEAALARAGLKVDPAVAAKGEEQSKQDQK